MFFCKHEISFHALIRDIYSQTMVHLIFRASLSTLLGFVISYSCFAQPVNRIRRVVDAGVAFKDNALNINFLHNQYLRVDRQGLLQIGWGLRVAHVQGSSLDFITAPSKLTTGKTGFASLSAPLLLRQIDTLQIKTGITLLNFNLGVQVALFDRLDVGVNADIIGFALGTKRSGYYLGSRGYSATDSLNIHQTYQEAKPARFNLQLLGDNALGSLNSEIYARLRLTQRVGIKVGYLFAINEYKTTQPLVDDNRRFRFRSQMLYLGLSFPIYN